MRPHQRHLMHVDALLGEARGLLEAQRPMIVSAAMAAESFPQPAWCFDRAHALLWGNKPFEVRYSVDTTKQRGMTAAEIWGQEHPEISKGAEEVMQTGIARTIDHFSGDTYTSTMVWPLLAEDGSCIGACGMVTS